MKNNPNLEPPLHPPANGQPAKKMIVLGHDATRSGAPILLLHLLHWLKRHGGLELEIILKQDGPLLAEFQRIAPTTVLEYTRTERMVHSLCQRLGGKIPEWILPPAKLARHLRGRKADLFYANTSTVGAEVAVATQLGLPVVWHIHELPSFINSIAGGKPFRDAGRHAQKFIAVSESVKAGLMASSAIPAEKISVIHGFVPPEKTQALDLPATRAAVRQELNLPPSAFVAGMCGTVCHGKGVDWFVAVAAALAADFADREIQLVWIGSPANEMILTQVNQDLRQARLTERVKFIGGKADSRPYLAALDAFLLSSRADSFPLVMLEAGALGLPVICFAGSGGAPEFVEADAGLVVPHADPAAAARALVKLCDNPELCRQLGANARQKVLTHYTVETQAPEILALMELTCRPAAEEKNLE